MPEKKQQEDIKFNQLSDSYWLNIRPLVILLILMGGLLSILQSCNLDYKRHTDTQSSEESQ